MTVQLPNPPVAANVDSSGYGDSIPKAWDKQDADAAADYAIRDDGSGSIANVGSPPTVRYVQTYDEAVTVLTP